MCDNTEHSDLLDDDTLFTYITQGYNRAEISRVTGLSQTVVRYRVQKLRAKYDASNDAEMVFRVMDSHKCYQCKNHGTVGL
ncbi:helix-turn-helix transcriptional regulator [Litorivivens sp.]|uniref:helix-turn-helix transcriptional regulator n=1 Tax=Litorivivens sp. TaxID=2020868 RepID=UPI003567DD3E